jgi:hypothetical protein
VFLEAITMAHTWWQRWRQKKAVAAKTQRRREWCLRHRAIPTLEKLEDRTLPSTGAQIFNDLEGITNAMQTSITNTMQTTLNSTLGGFQAIPVVGKGLQEFNDLANFVNQAASAFQGYGDAIPSSFSAGNLNVTADTSKTDVPITIHLDKSLNPTTLGNDPATKMPYFTLGMGNFLQVHGMGSITADIGFDMGLTFHTGSSPSLSFNSFSISFSAGLTPDFTAQATLNGLLQATVTNISGGNTQVSGTVSFGVDNNGHITTPTFSGSADADLHFDLGFAPQVRAPLNPHLGADFHLHGWKFTTADPTSGSSLDSTFSGSNGVQISFDNVNLLLDNVIPSFLQPIVQDVQKFTRPLQKYVDFFNQEVPIINQFGVHETFLDLLERKTGSLPLDGKTLSDAFDAITTINQLGSFASPTTAAISLLPSGQKFSLTPDAGAGGFFDLGSAQGTISNLFGPLGQLASGLESTVQDALGPVLDQFQSQQSYGLQFPFLKDPGNSAFQMLLGQDVNLFTYTMPPLDEHIDATLSADLGILGVGLTASLDVTADVSVGYDTAGLRAAVSDIVSNHLSNIPKDLFHGFFVDKSNTYANLTGGLTAFASAGVTVSGSIDAGIHLAISPYLPTDTNNANLVRLDDISADFPCNFALTGDVTAHADISLTISVLVSSVTLFDYTLATETLASFTVACDDTGSNSGFDSNYPQQIKLNMQDGPQEIDIVPYTTVNSVSVTNNGQKENLPTYEFGIEVNYVDGSNPHKEFYKTGTQDQNGNRTNFAPLFLVTGVNLNGPLFQVPNGNHSIIINKNQLDFINNHDPNFFGAGNPVHEINGTIWGGALLVGGTGDTTFISNLGDDDPEETSPVTMVGGGGSNSLQGGNTIYGGPSIGTTIAGASRVQLHAANYPDVDPNLIGNINAAIAIEPDRAGKETLIAPRAHFANLSAGAGKASFQAGVHGAGDSFQGGVSDAWFAVSTASGDVSIAGGNASNTLHYSDTETDQEIEGDLLSGGKPDFGHSVYLNGDPNGPMTFTAYEDRKTSTKLQTTTATGITSVEISHAGNFAVKDFIADFLNFQQLTGLAVHFSPTSPSNSLQINGSPSFGDNVTMGPDPNTPAQELFTDLLYPHGTEFPVQVNMYIRGMQPTDEFSFGNIFANQTATDDCSITLDSLQPFHMDIFPAPHSKLTVDASSFFGELADTLPTSVSIGDHTVTVSSADVNDNGDPTTLTASVEFLNQMSQLTVDGPNDGSDITMDRPNAAGDTTVQGGNGDNTFHINNARNNVHILTGGDKFTGGGHNHTTVAAAARQASLTIEGQGQDETYTVPFVPFDLTAIPIMNIINHVFNSTLNISDDQDYDIQNYFLKNGIVSAQFQDHYSNLADQITYNRINKLNVDTGPGDDDTVYVDSVPNDAATVNTHGVSSNTVEVARDNPDNPASQNLTSTLLGTLFVNGRGSGPTALILDDQGNTNAPNYSMDFDSVSRLNTETLHTGAKITVPHTVYFSGISNLTLNAAYDPETADTFAIQSPQVPLTTICDIFGPRAFDIAGSDTVDINGLAGALELQTYGPPTLHGNLQLNYATLSAIEGGPAKPSSTPITILDDDGSDLVSGTFDRLSEGTIFTTSDGLKLQVTYRGQGEGSLLDTQVTYLNTPPTIQSVKLPNVAVEGENTSGNVTFTDPDPADSHTVTVNWGDNTPTQTFNLDPGVTSFPLNHTFPEENSSNTVQMTITDPSHGTATYSTTLKVADAPLTLSPGTPAIIEGQPIAGPVAYLYDPAGDGTTDDYKIQIDWGDGTSGDASDGSVRIDAVGQNIFAISGDHAYTGDEGTSYRMRVMVEDTGGAMAVGPLTWQGSLDMALARSGAAAATGTDGRIFVFGGSNDQGATNSAAVFDPAAASWTSIAPLQTRRIGMAGAADAAGRIYAIGGTQIDPTLGLFISSTVEIYDPVLGTWSKGTNLPTAVVDAAAVRGNDGKIYVLGGTTSSGVTNLVQVYDPVAGSWEYLPSMPTARSGLAAVKGRDGKIYAIGGINSVHAVVGALEILDPAQGTWTTGSDLPTPRSGLGAAVGPDGNLYVIGGASGLQVMDTVEVYYPKAQVWGRAARLNTARAGMGIGVGGDGNIYALGGTSAFLHPLSSVEVLAPAPVTVTDPVQNPPTGLLIGSFNTPPSVITIQAIRGSPDEATPDDIRVLRNGAILYSGNKDSLSGIFYIAQGSSDIINIEGDYASVPISLHFQGGTNTINIYPAYSLLGADQGNIAITGGGYGTTTVNVHDEADANVNWMLGNGAVTGTSLGQAKISFDALAALNIFGGPGQNTFAVQDTAGITKESITVGTGTDTIQVGAAASSLDGIGSLKVNGNGQTVLVLDDEANRDRKLPWIGGTVQVQTRPTYVVTGQQVVRTNQITRTYLSGGQVFNTTNSTVVSTVQFSGISSMQLQGGTSPNVFGVQETKAATPVVIRPGTGGDVVNVGSDSVNLPQSVLDPIQGAVTVNGAGGNTILNFNDKGGTPGAALNQVYNYSLAQDTFSRTGTATVSYTGMATVNLYAANAGGSGFNDLGVFSTAPGTTTNVYAGTGLNEFLVFDITYTINGIQGPLNLHGTSGSLPNDDLVAIYDVDKTTRHTLFVNAGATPQSGMVQRYNADGSQTDAALISYDGLNAYAVVYTGESAGHTINVQSNASDLWTIIGAGATDTVNVGNSSHTLAAVQGDLRIQGGKPTVNVDDSADTVSKSIDMAGDPSYHNYLITGLLPQSSPVAGRFWLQLDPSAPVALKTGTGDDVFRVHDFTGAPAISIYAEPATSTRSNMHNKLDYSLYTGNVTVDLPLQKATGFAKVTGIQDVSGSQGDDILVGDANPNILIGGTGRNLIIGGAGADHLFGGNLDNILIAGYTLYDQNLIGLEAIMKEWLSGEYSTGDNYATRVKKISAGVVGSDGKLYALIGGNGQARTVFDDGVLDVLTCTPNTDTSVLDWLFTNTFSDQVVNPKKKDTTVPLF